MSLGWWILLAAIAILLWGIRYYQDAAGRPPERTFPQTPANSKSERRPTGEVRSKRGIFTVRVAAFDFDWEGARLLVNGEFHNGDSHLTVELVTASVGVGGWNEKFYAFDPDGETAFGDNRMATLVTFSGSVSLAPGEMGLFRTPLLVNEEGSLADLADDLSLRAAAFVQKCDREMGSYAVDEQGIVDLYHKFNAIPEVSAIRAEALAALFWAAGPVSIRVDYSGYNEREELYESGEPGEAKSFESNLGQDEYDGDDDSHVTLDEIDMSVQLSASEATALQENVDLMIKNALRRALELDEYPLGSVTLHL